MMMTLNNFAGIRMYAKVIQYVTQQEEETKSNNNINNNNK